MSVMLSPLPFGVLTRKDDPNTSEDERLHDQNSRDAGVPGNIQNWPVTSMFDGVVITAGPFHGYGLTVRVEGSVAITKRRILTARAKWPMQLLDPGFDNASMDKIYTMMVRALYGHGNFILVMQGDPVSRLQPLMGMGNTGQSNGNHVHVKVRLLKLPEPTCFVDPYPLFQFFPV